MALVLLLGEEAAWFLEGHTSSIVEWIKGIGVMHSCFNQARNQEWKMRQKLPCDFIVS